MNGLVALVEVTSVVVVVAAMVDSSEVVVVAVLNALDELLDVSESIVYVSDAVVAVLLLMVVKVFSVMKDALSALVLGLVELKLFSVMLDV